MNARPQLICVTGAGGTVGSELVARLEAAHAPFRAAFHSQAKADAGRTRGLDAMVIDYDRPESLRAAFEGCERLFLLGPNLPRQVQLELNAVEAARDAGIRHIVKQSVLHADEAAYELGRIHRQVEQAIESSGLDWTFLRPNSFMQNVVTFMSPTIKAESAFYTAAGDGKVSHVDVRDIAAVAEKALTGSGHEGRAYTLTGPEALTYDELAGELSNVLGRTIAHVNLSPADYREGLLATGAPEEIADRLIDLERFFRDGRASLVTDEIERVTGREPLRFAQYARACARQLGLVTTPAD